MSSRTFRNKKSLRKTKRKRNAGQLKDAYLAMSVGGKIEVYKLQKARKSVKLTGGMWPFSNEQPSMFESSQPSMFDQEQPSMFESSQPSMFESPQPTMLEKITSAFKPKEEQSTFV